MRALADASAEVAEEDAMVRVYLQRELEGRVTDEAVRGAHDALARSAQAQGARGALPPLERVRPQIERQLEQEALRALRAGLQGGVAVVFHGPDGQPTEPQPAAGGGGGGQPTGGAGAGGAAASQGRQGEAASQGAPQDAPPEGQAGDAGPSDAQPSDTR